MEIKRGSSRSNSVHNLLQKGDGTFKTNYVVMMMMMMMRRRRRRRKQPKFQWFF
jgi:hypothetical protein